MYKAEYKKWLAAEALSDKERQELLRLAGDEAELESRFFAPLSFGTAGLRGVLGVGLNRMNVHVVRHATQGFAGVIQAAGQDAKDRGVVICYDCRNGSALFAKEAACVMAANGIFVRLFSKMRPTPELSFAIRHYGATGGINITASHNPKEYNGYKVYWSDGAQLPPAHAKTVADVMAGTDLFADVHTMAYNEAVSLGRIMLLEAETDEAFLQAVLGQSVAGDKMQAAANELKIVYTPFHGTGAELVPEVLRRLGVGHIFPVPEQMVPDGNFSTVESPNPENPEGFYLAVALAQRENADLIIGTDPDTDRVAALVKADGAYPMITGNQMGVLLLNYLIQARRAKGSLPENAAAITTIVTTEMARAVAEAGGVAMYTTFTGFKFMAEKMSQLQGEKEVIFCYEESYGYMTGDYVRDKDAVTASMLIAEMAAWYKCRNMSLLDGLEELYLRHGYYMEKTLNLVMPGLDGLKKMAALMESLREEPPAQIGGKRVTAVRDYLSGMEKSGEEERAIPLSGSNVLSFVLADGTVFIVRPSGTEPKIKVYILAKGDSRADCEETIRTCTGYAELLEK